LSGEYGNKKQEEILKWFKISVCLEICHHIIF
jgi:hypothetical protein